MPNEQRFQLAFWMDGFSFCFVCVLYVYSCRFPMDCAGVVRRIPVGHGYALAIYSVGLRFVFAV